MNKSIVIEEAWITSWTLATAAFFVRADNVLVGRRSGGGRYELESTD